MFGLPIAPGEAEGPVELGQLLLAIIVTVGTVLIFLAALFLVFRLWRIVFDALVGTKTLQVEALAKLLGGIEIDATTGEEKMGQQGRFRIAGVGLLGTLLVVLFAFLTARYGLDFHFSTSSQPHVEYINMETPSDELQSLVTALTADGYSLRTEREGEAYVVTLNSPDGVTAYHARGETALEALKDACEMAKWQKK